MTSQIRVDEITNRSGLGTVTIYDNGFEFTGVTTFTEDVDITGGLTIGGVLTYEDVTNIDSVGVVTARGGLDVSDTGTPVNIDSTNSGLNKIHFKTGGTTSGYLGNNSTYFFSLSDSSGNQRVRHANSGLYQVLDTSGNVIHQMSGTGKIGIGTAPVGDLTVLTTSDGYVDINGSGGNGAEIRFLKKSDRSQTYTIQNNGGVNELVQHVLAHSSGRYSWSIGGTERLRLTSAGRMGLGTNDPNALLEVRDSENTTQGNAQIRISKGVGAGAAPATITRANTYLHLGGTEWGSGANGKYLIGLGYTNDEVGTGIPAYMGFTETSVSGYTQGDLIFGTRGNTTGTDNPTERLRIAANGDIGIANASPTNWGGGVPTIEIKGTANTGSNSTRSGAIAFESGSGSNGYAVLWGQEGGIHIYTSATDRASTTYSSKFHSDGNLHFASGKGISFAATSDASGMGSELLDDYEEGTWTPSLQGAVAGTGLFTPNGAGNGGIYRKVGGLVYIQGNLRGTWSQGTSSGLIHITGLPITNRGSVSGEANANYGPVNITYAAGLTPSPSGYYQCGGLVIQGSNIIHVYKNNGNGGGIGNIIVSEVSTASDGVNWHFSACYAAAG